MVLHFEMPGCMYVCVRESVFVCSSVHVCVYVCVYMVLYCVCIYRIVLMLRPVFMQVCVYMCVFVCECMCDSMCKCARGRAGACERCVKMFGALVLLHSCMCANLCTDL